MVERRTVHISAGKDNKTVVDFVEELEAKKGKREAIKQVSCDMSPAFIKGVKENLPKAEITFDKFHIIKLINEVVDQVRREEGRYTPELKGHRYIFLKNSINLTEKQKGIKDELSLAKLNLKSVRAMHIRENFNKSTLLMYFKVYQNNTGSNAVDFVDECKTYFPFYISHILTDNGAEFTDKFTCKKKKASGNHDFDMACIENDIDYRLTAPFIPKTNGMIERVNGTIKDATVKVLTYKDETELKADLDKFLVYYNLNRTW